MFKLMGIIAVFLSCVSFGFFKSFELIKQRKLLLNIHKGMKSLESGINYSKAELHRLLVEAFGDIGEIEIKGNKAYIKKGTLKNKDYQMICEFLSGLGTLDTKSEVNRIKLYIKLVSDALSEAEVNQNKGVKLWQTVGISVGLGLVIILV